MIGTLIDGSYRVEQVLGEGGFGTVYRCTDVDLERPVAVKMLHPGMTSEAELGRILAEGKNLASLSHSNVVQVHRLGSHEGRPYIVMEYLDGRSLAALRHDGALALGRCLEIMHQVASGLRAIHEMGILHRDLSTRNILITSQGRAKILDLGLSRDMGRVTTADSRGALLGTLAYAAPEHIAGQPASVRSEVFSFGVILYEVLTGENPFQADHYMSMLYNIAQRTPTPVEERVPGCPPELAGLVRECLAKRPGDRPRDMAEVERRLGELLARPGLGGGQGPALPAVTATRRQRSRNPYLNRVMIKNSEDFIGRQQEVKRIFARLDATPPGSISIVGERKIGKSSLLNHVYMQAQRQKHLDQPEKMVMVFLDFQEQKAMSMEAFVRLLLTMVALELRGQVDLAGCAPSLDGIKDMVQRLAVPGLRLAILLDEFDIVTTNPNFGLEFFSFLRFLANHYDVAYLTSSGRDLQMLCHTKEISDSPFFNIFSTMRLSVFQREEALELIRGPSERVGLPLAPYAEQILTLAGRFPFFLQMACSHAIEYLDEHPGIAEPDFREIRQRFAQEAWLHYRYIWDGFDGHQRSALLRMAQGRSIPDALRHVVEELASKHYVDTEKSPSGLFSASFEEFIRTEGARGERKPSLLDRLWRRPGR